MVARAGYKSPNSVPVLMERAQCSGESAYERIESDYNLRDDMAEADTDGDDHCHSTKFSVGKYISNTTTDHTAQDESGNACLHGYQATTSVSGAGKKS